MTNGVRNDCIEFSNNHHQYKIRGQMVRLLCIVQHRPVKEHLIKESAKCR